MKILHLDSSILGNNSVSKELGNVMRDALQQAFGETTVTYHDLVRDEIPHLSDEILSASFIPEGEWSTTQHKERQRSEQLISELLESEILLIAAPMYNFSIPSQLKAWIDRVAVAGRTFKYTENGPVGLASGKKVFVISARGGIYSNEQGKTMDFQEDYLRTALGFLGMSDIAFIRAEAVAMGSESRQHAIAQAREQIAAVVASIRQ